MKIATFDVGGTFIKYALIHDDIMSHQGKVPTPCDNQENFLDTIDKILKKLGRVDGIAFSLPGVINVDKKYIFAGGSLKYNNHTDIKEWEKRFQLTIEVENDARCAALAELKSGNMKGIKNGLVITFGTGVGGGIIINGDIYKGSHLIGGELSVIFSKDMKTNGSKGFFGSIGSVANLVNKIAAAKNINTKDGKIIFQWIEIGDEVACNIFENYCYEVIQQFHNLQCIIDPERICIGGGASENPVFINGLKQAAQKFYNSFPIAFPHAEIVKCRYCNDANLLGAYYHYIEKQR